MKVVFLEDVPGTANIGDIKDVKPGFARNYLLPRRLAIPATEAVVKTAKQRAEREARLQDQRDADARKLAEKVDGVSYEVRVKAGASGKLFGSVGTADIAQRVGETLGIEFERQNVVLHEPIKELGDYQVPVRLTKNVIATVNVAVIGEDGTTAADIRARQEGGKREEPGEAATAAVEAGPEASEASKVEAAAPEAAEEVSDTEAE